MVGNSVPPAVAEDGDRGLEIPLVVSAKYDELVQAAKE